jgi:hypothetical protein
MPNAIVRAAATGLPALSRRSLIGAMVAVPAAAPPIAVASNAAAAFEDDPALRAIAEWRPIKAQWLAALETAGDAADAAAAVAGPRPQISFRGQTTDGVGEPFVYRFFDQFAPLDGDAREARTAALKASADYFNVKSEADRIERVRELEDIGQALCSREADALTKAMTTLPTTVAGLHAVIMLMASEPDTLGECAAEATASLAAAASAILGFAQT